MPYNGLRKWYDYASRRTMGVSPARAAGQWELQVLRLQESQWESQDNESLRTTRVPGLQESQDHESPRTTRVAELRESQDYESRTARMSHDIARMSHDFARMLHDIARMSHDITRMLHKCRMTSHECHHTNVAARMLPHYSGIQFKRPEWVQLSSVKSQRCLVSFSDKRN